ncbi:NUDIX hydrolase [Candidatus Nanohalobium constans]|uniref:NUDIX family hydrolase n=1 Tax=Candidatus Nanohalobium constans TaxID=2565781 RepID=A0A5Q0UG96_9ARCH|nr:NUDIX domain-containing protein [Candidatus Nanohalobium constans]QGA80411.1 NUDIX family hydrolase [Candidatus Nanohalobium constans]
MEMPEFSPDYCPDCGNRLDSKFIDGRERLFCEECDDVVWLNPDVAAGFIVRKEDKVLLQKRKIEPHSGKWSIPAGYLELDEKPLEGAKRELREETGLKVTGNTQFVDHVSLKHPDGRRVVVAVYLVGFEGVEGELNREEEEVEKLELWKYEKIQENKADLDYEVYLNLIEKIREE